MSNDKLPIKPRAKAVRARESVESIDWLALWVISLGVCAVILAAIAYFSIGDRIGAALILVGAATLIASIMSANAHGYF